MQFNAASGQSNSGSDAWDICYRISGACSGSAPLAECCSSHCPLRSRLHGIRLVWRTYQQLLTKHPWKVQILTAGSTCGISDIISQQLIERRGLTDHSIKRTIKMTTVGLIYVGPILCKWYKYLDQLVVGKTKVAVFKKVLLDQNYTNALMSNYTIWPAAQLLNFYFIPLKHRLAVVQIVALVWNTYLSWMANKA
ncbi:protein Mpv17 isoform X4 [Leucoraja erinacea]|uniref:protein Mpv17 isoform X4 n=1 Tax=Leucoraja erinaceus TaxID=7782 RepID=UPI002455B71E|nr:protein Mpv17 isoform X4 [Leucoraja erinacea]